MEIGVPVFLIILVLGVAIGENTKLGNAFCDWVLKKLM